jgi:hypothetical protein
VEDSNGVTELNSVEYLQECLLGEMIVSNKVAMLGDVGEQVAFRTELEDDECTVGAVENTDEGNHVGMLTCPMVELNLSTLDTPLARIKASPGKRFHSIWNVGQDIDGLVDESEGSHSEDRNKFQAAS